MTVMTLGELAELVEGRVIGDADLKITTALPLLSAESGCITLVDNARYAESLGRSPAAAAVVPEGFPSASQSLLVVAKPHAAFEKIIVALRGQSAVVPTGIDPSASIHPTAQIGRDVTIYPRAVIGAGSVVGDGTTIHSGVQIMTDCRVGKDCCIYPNATLYDGTLVGDRVTLHAGVVLGAFGFGYRMVGGKHVRTAQLGWVEVHDDAELGACTTVDRGTYGPTVIGEGSKLDNQVMIGHNCRIGKHNLLCAHVGIAGSSTTGDYVVMGGQVGIKDHLHIQDRVVIAAQAGVMTDIPAGEVWQGCPAVPQKHSMMQIAITRKLPEMRQQLRDIERELAELRDAIRSSTDESSTAGDESERRAA